jgi:predicted ATPase
MGLDPGVSCRSFAAWTLWLPGYPAQTLARTHEALALAHALSHPLSLVYARCFAACVSQLRRDMPAAHEHAEAAVALARGFPQWVAWGTSCRGWALAMQGQGEEGLAQVRQRIAGFQATGAALFVPYFYTFLADVSAHLGHIAGGLQALAEAHSLVEQQGKRDEARTLLVPIYGWFTEGFDTADLQEAKALLEEWS